MTETVVLASNNLGKLHEFRHILAPLGIDFRTQNSLNIPEANEPYLTFVENALAKARHASRYAKLPALADDSGICVRALHGAPGVWSARYAGEPKSDAENNKKLVADLKIHSDRVAYYYCVLVYVRHAHDPQPLIAEGRWDGEIIDIPLGEGGFGYDAHFWLPQLGKTAAQLPIEEKNSQSHRALALKELLKKWR